MQTIDNKKLRNIHWKEIDLSKPIQEIEKKTVPLESLFILSQSRYENSEDYEWVVSTIYMRTTIFPEESRLSFVVWSSKWISESEWQRKGR